MRLREYRGSDAAALSAICLLTGNGGRNATGLYENKNLLANYYALPYARLYPEFTTVLEDDQEVVGYVLGTPDSAEFGRRCEAEWFPHLREDLLLPTLDDQSQDARILRRIFGGHPRENRYPDYPAHLHIDLLPVAQSSGWGRKMMERFLDQMRNADVTGVHLGVGIANENAIGFYEHLGFEPIAEEPMAVVLGLKW